MISGARFHVKTADHVWKSGRQQLPPSLLRRESFNGPCLAQITCRHPLFAVVGTEFYKDCCTCGIMTCVS